MSQRHFFSTTKSDSFSFFLFHSLVKAYEELNEYLKNEDELKQQPDFVAASEVLQQAKEKIECN